MRFRRYDRLHTFSDRHALGYDRLPTVYDRHGLGYDRLIHVYDHHDSNQRNNEYVRLRFAPSVRKSILCKILVAL